MEPITSMKFIQVTVQGPRGSQTTIAFLDDGSEVTLIDEGLARRLGLCTQQMSQLKVKGIHGKCKEVKSAYVDIKLTTDMGEFQLNNTRTFPVNVSFSPVDWRKEAGKFPHLRGIIPPTFEKGLKVELLIGSDNKKLITPVATVSGGFDEPVAEQTHLGWIFSGPLGT